MADSQVTINHFNAVYDKIVCDPGTAQDISDHFTFMVPGYKYMPLYKNKVWDGKIRLFNTMSRTLYAGLRKRLLIFLEERGIPARMDASITERVFSAEDTATFIQTLGLPDWVEARHYQYMAVMKAIRKRRILLVSPTNSGKTLMSYMIARYHNRDGKNGLLIVPDTGLVHQTADKMVAFGYPENDVHRIFSGQEKDLNVPLTVSTWQSIQKLPQKWFNQFGFVIGDEAHTFAAKSLKGIMEKCVLAEDRIAMTGSLDGSKTNELTIEGLFGPQYRTTTTRKLIDAGQSADLSIKVMMLTYSDYERKLIHKAEYPDEISFLLSNEKRNDFIVGLVLDERLKGNTLITYRYVDRHGVPLYNKIVERVGSSRKVYLINKDVPGEDRIEIANIVNQETDAIIVASSRTFATGIDLPNLNNLILSAPTRSQIQLLQSLGRTLRVSETKNSCEVYDVADDLLYTARTGKQTPNHTLRHFEERMKIYYAEQYKPRIHRIQL